MVFLIIKVFEDCVDFFKMVELFIFQFYILFSKVFDVIVCCEGFLDFYVEINLFIFGFVILIVLGVIFLVVVEINCNYL